MPDSDGWADGLVLTLALRQTADPAAALLRCVRAVRPGGRVVVADVLAHGEVRVLERLGPGFTGFAREELVALMRSCGLEDVRLVDPVPQPEPSSHEDNGRRTPRSRDVPRLAPLHAVGVVPGAGGRRRRTR